MRIRDVNSCLRAISDEYAWRKKELIDFRLSVASRNATLKLLFIRAGVPLAYAHWEGFVKNATEHLLNYVSHLPLRNDELSDVFFAHSAKTQIARLVESARVTSATQAACFVRDSAQELAVIRHKNYVDTESNLSAHVFDQIAQSVGVDTKHYKYLYPYIDESILHCRNKIAHGETVKLSESDFRALTDRVVDLIHMYCTDLQNIAVSGGFRRASSA
jgi:hypothetical protein